MPSDHSAPRLPTSLAAKRQGKVGVLWLACSEKRNAPADRTLLGIEAYFAELGHDIEAVVLASEGCNFAQGLDDTDLLKRGNNETIEHSHIWRRALTSIQFGKVPVVAVLHGAVIGGGLALAAAAHIRVAERSAYYALPEGSFGICLGSRAVTQLRMLIGIGRMMDMVLTGRTYSAEEGQVIGLSTYLVDEGKGLCQALDLAKHIAENNNDSLGGG
jgi:enoyl-CoA hydratase/carnithine racemase